MKPLPTHFNFLGRCPVKSCATLMRVTVPAKLTKKVHNFGSMQYPDRRTVEVAEPAWNPWQLYIHCARHHYQIGFRMIEGTLSEKHVCDARCVNAKGPNCECSCGGENHGAAHAI